jgi:hypothetical protein
VPLAVPDGEPVALAVPLRLVVAEGLRVGVGDREPVCVVEAAAVPAASKVLVKPPL